MERIEMIEMVNWTANEDNDSDYVPDPDDSISKEEDVIAHKQNDGASGTAHIARPQQDVEDNQMLPCAAKDCTEEIFSSCQTCDRVFCYDHFIGACPFCSGGGGGGAGSGVEFVG